MAAPRIEVPPIFTAKGEFTETHPRCVVRTSVETPPGILPRRTRDVLALVDTGSEMTMIREQLATELRLPPDGVASVCPPVGPPQTRLTTGADIVLHGESARVYTVTIKIVTVDGDFEDDIELLLGMNAFVGGRFVIDFRERRWVLTFPP